MISNFFSNGSVNKKGARAGSAKRFRIGDRVQRGNRETGVVRSFSPEGSVVVHFDGQRGSRPVFPSLLRKSN
jgi:hypothetical protein